jgi:hypothetical protein
MVAAELAWAVRWMREQAGLTHAPLAKLGLIKATGMGEARPGRARPFLWPRLALGSPR